MKKIIDQEQLLEAVFCGVEAYLHTDTTDYDNFCGIRDMGRFIWRNLDKRAKCHKEKLTLKSTRKIDEIIQSKLEERDKDYKKIIGRLYLKTPKDQLNKGEK